MAMGTRAQMCTEADDDCDGRDAGPVPMAVLADEPRVGFDEINAALAVGGDGAHIVVCPGTWPVETAVIEGVAVRISSWSGDPEDTALDAGHLTRHLLVADAEVTLEGLTLENGEATPAGGSVMIRDAAVLTVTHSVFRRNRASELGGVFVSDGLLKSLALNFDGVRFEENAGLLYVEAANVTAAWTDVVFDGNLDIGEGLVELTARADLDFSLSDAVVFENRAVAAIHDGGAYFDLTGNGDAEIVVERSTFEDNEAHQALFAISTLNGGEFVLRESVFRRNVGANTSLLTADIQTDITVDDCDFSTGTDDNSSPEFSIFRQRSRDLGDAVSFSCSAFDGCDW